MNNSKETKQQRDGLPRWIKRTAAIVGILATATAIFTGIYQVSLQWRRTAIDIEKERTKQQQAVKGAEEARLHLKNAELEIEKEKTNQKQAEKERAQIELQQREAEEVRNEKKQRHEQDRLKEKEILQAISDIADKKEPAWSALVFLSSNVHGEHSEQILEALLIKAMSSESTIEIEYIFELFNNMMYTNKNPDYVFKEVLELNRKAFKQFKASLLKFFWHETKEILDRRIKFFQEYDLGAFEGKLSALLDYLRPAIRSISEEISLIHPRFQELILYEALVDFSISFEEKGLNYARIKSKTFDVQESIGIVRQRLVIDALIVDYTKRFIEKFLVKNRGEIDLSKTYLSGIKITSDLKDLALKFDNAIVFDPSGNEPFSVFRGLGDDLNYFMALLDVDEFFINLGAKMLAESALNPEGRNNLVKYLIKRINENLADTDEAVLAGRQLNLKNTISLFLEWRLYQARLEKLKKAL